MSFKEKIYRKCRKNALLKRLYTNGSYIKNKVIYWFKLAYPILRYKRTHSNPVFLVFTPEHLNLGDHAIAWAEKKKPAGKTTKATEKPQKDLQESMPVEDLMKIMSLEDAKKYIVPFGEFKGKSLEEVSLKDPKSVNWYAKWITV